MPPNPPPPSGSRLTRRRLLAGTGIAAAALPAALAIDGFLITPRRLSTSRHTLGHPSAAGKRLRIAQITDLHMASVGPLHEALLSGLHDLEADLVVLTGDMIERPEGTAALGAFLAELPDVPMFAALGNWEYWSGVPRGDYQRLYDTNGIDLLVNRSVTISHEGVAVRITGLDDLAAGRPDPAASLAEADPVPNHLLLAHCPGSRDECPLPEGHAPSLVLAGHTHGGQIAPFGHAFVLPPGSGRYVAGWYRENGPPMYVSRGIGTSLLPVRIGASPELAVFDWNLA